jgi:molybdopterin-guanine dinucleotide biosynthesis protein A
MGRPAHSKDVARPHRVVTFVTEAQSERLKEIAQGDDRSLSAVIYRIISHYLNVEQIGPRE